MCDACVLKVVLTQGFPTWSTCTPGVHLPIRRGTFKASRRWEKYIYILFISKYLYIHHWVLFPKIIVCLLLNMSMNDHDNISCHRKF